MPALGLRLSLSLATAVAMAAGQAEAEFSRCGQDADCQNAGDLGARCQVEDGAAEGVCVCSNGEQAAEAEWPHVCLSSTAQHLPASVYLHIDVACADLPSQENLWTNVLRRVSEANVEAEVKCYGSDDPTEEEWLSIWSDFKKMPVRRAHELLGPGAFAVAVEAEAQATEGLEWVKHVSTTWDLGVQDGCTLPNTEWTLLANGTCLGSCRRGFHKGLSGCIEDTPVPTAVYACDADHECQLAGDDGARCTGSGTGQGGCVCSVKQPEYTRREEPPAEGRVCLPAELRVVPLAFRFAFDADCALATADRLEALEDGLSSAVGVSFLESLVPTCSGTRLVLQGGVYLLSDRVPEVARGADFAAVVDAVFSKNAALKPLGALVPGSARLTAGQDCPLPNATVTVQTEAADGACVAVMCAKGYSLLAPKPLEPAECVEWFLPPYEVEGAPTGMLDAEKWGLGLGIGLGLGLPVVCGLFVLGLICYCRRKAEVDEASDKTVELKSLPPV